MELSRQRAARGLDPEELTAVNHLLMGAIAPSLSLLPNSLLESETSLSSNGSVTH